MLLHVAGELRLEVAEDGAGLAVADGPRVDLNHRYQLGRSAGEPALLRFVKLKAGETLLLHRVAVLGGDLRGDGGDAREPGDEVTLTIIREREESEVAVTLEEIPQ